MESCYKIQEEGKEIVKILEDDKYDGKMEEERKKIYHPFGISIFIRSDFN